MAFVEHIVAEDIHEVIVEQRGSESQLRPSWNRLKKRPRTSVKPRSTHHDTRFHANTPATL